MRLAPVPIFYHNDIESARKFAYLSSLTTHPGQIAAEACAFMAHVIVRALTRTSEGPESAKVFLDRVCEEYEEVRLGYRSL